ncbi:precorrin-2 C(20)-methyltransferase [Tepidimicrobium xylanilyticum]|uniref:Cobalt-factor II C20-methyltransferase n=1 Tax=Tepidimicrobium xylanilyticum TaxID=1123352 RepID=A0A1H2TJJ9_9FIRM|nr:precorrin-2 C(20)-methyltransferase [Tepidimicrobium xylanilyticum]GMG95929.1 precorrin-2 C(20)-methyltransferase [Tepidimicrobium xylanilyticum]SDW43947.1 cobalt-factor II C20-methyltransferase [Tepidimicrobium xylanilyticum]
MKILYAIGTGPGDKELLTIKAVKRIREADIIFAPHNKGKNMALDTVKEYVQDKKVILLNFPMGKVTKQDYTDVADTIHDLIPEGKCGVYLTIGDPMIYSTFIYLMNELEKREIQIDIISGIPSFIAAAAQTKIPLVIKGDKFLLMDEFCEELLDDTDTLCILKTLRDKEAILESLDGKGFNYTYVKRVSLEDEHVLTDKEEIINDKDYMSLILGRKKDND